MAQKTFKLTINFKQRLAKCPFLAIEIKLNVNTYVNTLVVLPKTTAISNMQLFQKLNLAREMIDGFVANIDVATEKFTKPQWPSFFPESSLMYFSLHCSALLIHHTILSLKTLFS